jgi:hypothetical protein
MSTIRPAFAEFAQKHCGASAEQVSSNLRTIDTRADDPAEADLSAVFETYVNASTAMNASEGGEAIGQMLDAGKDSPAADATFEQIMQSVVPEDQPHLVPGKFIAGSDGIFGVELYGMGNPFDLEAHLLGGHAGTLFVDTTPHQDGVQYYLHADSSYKPEFDPRELARKLLGE